MRIGINAQLLSLTETYRAAGVSNYIYYLLNSFSRVDRHNDYTVFTGRWAQEPALRALLPLSENFHLCPSRLPTHLPPVRLFWEQTVQALRTRHLDVLHGPVHAIPLVARPPRVVTVHDLSFLLMPEKHLRAKRNYQNIMARLSVRRAHRVITDSGYIRENVIQLLGVPAEKVVTIPLAAGPEFHHLATTPAGQCDLEDFRRKKGLPPRYYLFLSTLEPRKNIPALLRAYALLRQEGMGDGSEPPLLVVAGAKGWLYEEIFALVKALHLEPHVLFPGFIPREEVVWWYNAALAFVLLSVHEGFGLPPLEAMACGTPVVVNENAVALREVAQEAGLCVDAESVQEVAEALRSVAVSPDLHADLRQRGLERAAQFSWERTATQTLQVYESVAR